MSDKKKKQLPIRVVTLKENGELSEEAPKPGKKVKLRGSMSSEDIRALMRRRREELVAESQQNAEGN